MKATAIDKPLIAIACGGTGGHLFPGLAIAEKLIARGADVTLLISPKEVDQQAVKSAYGMEVVVLPAVGLTRRHLAKFLGGFMASYSAAKSAFRTRPPQAVLAMGGFTSAPPVFAGRSFGAITFLHESNTIPGRANRLLAHFVDQAFVGFSTAAGRLFNPNVLTTGTPVRPQFDSIERAACRMSLGLAPDRPVLLIMGGSQGAAGINDLALRAVPELIEKMPTLQILHLAGFNEQGKVEAAYAGYKGKVVIRPFLTEMELALGAADAAVSRAGASSLAELAAMHLPAVLIPYPTAADNHQLHNARAFVEAGAAAMLDQRTATGTQLADAVLKLLQETVLIEQMRHRLSQMHTPDAAELIAEKMMRLMEARMHRTFGKRPPGTLPGVGLGHPQTSRNLAA
jgi:UDP-N-acetylglucosamine--N-acetylmuramyl-(pentapeptide) pyrophosphoryl-undecaprenol N-acetylglucosamine transferase